MHGGFQVGRDSSHPSDSAILIERKRLEALREKTERLKALRLSNQMPVRPSFGRGVCAAQWSESKDKKEKRDEFDAILKHPIAKKGGRADPGDDVDRINMAVGEFEKKRTPDGDVFGEIDDPEVIDEEEFEEVEDRPKERKGKRKPRRGGTLWGVNNPTTRPGADALHVFAGFYERPVYIDGVDNLVAWGVETELRRESQDRYLADLKAESLALTRRQFQSFLRRHTWRATHTRDAWGCNRNPVSLPTRQTAYRKAWQTNYEFLTAFVGPAKMRCNRYCGQSYELPVSAWPRYVPVASVGDLLLIDSPCTRSQRRIAHKVLPIPTHAIDFDVLVERAIIDCQVKLEQRLHRRDEVLKGIYGDGARISGGSSGLQVGSPGPNDLPDLPWTKGLVTPDEYHSLMQDRRVLKFFDKQNEETGNRGPEGLASPARSFALLAWRAWDLAVMTATALMTMRSMKAAAWACIHIKTNLKIIRAGKILSSYLIRMGAIPWARCTRCQTQRERLISF